MITPASGGTTSRRISLSRWRSVSGSLRLMPVDDAPGHVHQIAAGQRHLRGQPRALVSDRVLADLDDDVVARLERLLDLAAGAAETRCLPVHFARVQHAVAAAADVDERRLHRGQHVLHDAEVDVADQRRRRRPRSRSARRPRRPRARRSACSGRPRAAARCGPCRAPPSSARRLRGGPGTRPRSGSAAGAGPRRDRPGGAAAWPPAGSIR